MAPAVHQDGIDAGLKCPAQLMLGRVFVDCPVRQNHIDGRVPRIVAGAFSGSDAVTPDGPDQKANGLAFL